MYIYADSTSFLTLGILDNDFKWKEFTVISERKVGTQIHAHIYHLLNKHNLDLVDIDGFIFIAGPGSYTGMRVTEGMAQILEWQGLPVFSFYHYDVPKILEEDKGTWITMAFRGEWFIHEWDNDNERQSILPIDQADSVIRSASQPVFTSYQHTVQDLFEKNILTSIKETNEMIFTGAEKIFPAIVNNRIRKHLFYFRTPEQEFKTSAG